MSQTLLSAIVCGTVSGAVAAGVVSTILTSPGASEAAPTALLPTEQTASVSPEEFKDLQKRYDELYMRLESIESLGTQRVAAAVSVDQAPLTNQEVEEMLASLATPGTAVDPLFQSKVAAAMQRIEEDREQEREQEEFERIQEQVDERLEELQTELGLDGNQKNSLRTILVDERVKRNETMRAMRESGNWSRDEFRKLRDETEQALSGVLTPTQMESYESDRGDRRRGFGGGGGGNDRGGNTGGGGGGENGGGGRGRGRGGF